MRRILQTLVRERGRTPTLAVFDDVVKAWLAWRYHFRKRDLCCTWYPSALTAAATTLLLLLLLQETTKYMNMHFECWSPSLLLYWFICLSGADCWENSIVSNREQRALTFLSVEQIFQCMQFNCFMLRFFLIWYFWRKSIHETKFVYHIYKTFICNCTEDVFLISFLSNLWSVIQCIDLCGSTLDFVCGWLRPAVLNEGYMRCIPYIIMYRINKVCSKWRYPCEAILPFL
jgi:hypothetical protein